MNYSKVFYTGSLSEHSFLVTGGAGFIGSHIVEYLLLHQAQKVCVIDNLSNGSIQNIQHLLQHPNLQFVEADISDYAVCQLHCSQTDFVIHQAALGSVPRSIANPLPTHASNATGFLNMLEAARLAEVKRMVFASSSSVYGDNTDFPKQEDKTGKPLSPYAVTKISNELYAHTYAQLHQFPVTGLRYFNIFGPRQNPRGPYAAAIPLFIESLLKGEPCYINGDGEQARDFTYVENAVQANIRALFYADAKSNGQVFNIACAQSISVNAIYKKITQMLQSDAAPIYRDERMGDVRNSLADVTRAKNLLQYSPEVFFDEGIAQTIAWYKQQVIS